MKYAIGIDLGGTGVKGGLVDENGKILKSLSTKTSKVNKEVIIAIADLINELTIDFPIEGVGVGSPGTIDYKEGKVLTIGGNVEGWIGMNLKKELEAIFPNIKFKIDNDANCAGLCEMWLGAGKGYDSALAITLGTGLGGFIFYKDHIIRGSKYRASELGHTILYPNGRLCACGQRGCTERYVGGTGLEETYFEFAGKRKSGFEIMESFKTDSYAKMTVEKFVDDLATATVSFKNFFDPEVFIVGGGVINSSHIWWEDYLRAYKEKINAFDQMPIVKAKFLNNAGIIGAASLILNEYE